MAITKEQLISDIAEAIDTPKSTVRAALEQLSEIVSDALENGDEITLPGIGKLKVSERPARTGRNPQTGQALQIAAKKIVKYVPAKALSDAINCKRSAVPPKLRLTYSESLSSTQCR